eukprot:4540934-Pyramimonas_sp.AAC.1
MSWYVCDRSPFDFGGPSVAYIESSLRREYQAENGWCVCTFPCTSKPSTRATYSVAEETFGDGIWVTAEIVYYAKPIIIKGSPDQFVSEPFEIVLYELRLYHWTPAAIHAAPAYAFLQR